MSRRYVKSFPALSSGFETETELTVHALELHMPITEINTPYKDRPVGSQSKLSTFRDGWRVLWTILVLVKEERPMQFFFAAGLFVCVGLACFDLPDFERIFGDGPCASLADSRFVDGHDDLGFSQFFMWAYS